MTKISKKAQAAETTAEVVNTPAEPQSELVEAPKEPILEEPTSDVEFESESDDISGDAFELLDALEDESLPSLDEIKAKERALRKR